MPFSPEIELLTNYQLHKNVIHDVVLCAEKFVWIATANLKDMHVRMAHSYKPILELFDRMARDGVTFRIIHCDLPSRSFRNTLERFEELTSGPLELQICPRCHWKMVIADSKFAYLGTANFTGAGLGAKSEGKRNLEIGITSWDPGFVKNLEEQFDTFWIGAYCQVCYLREKCPDPIIQD